jgi:hypothetical protein
MVIVNRGVPHVAIKRVSDVAVGLAHGGQFPWGRRDVTCFGWHCVAALEFDHGHPVTLSVLWNIGVCVVRVWRMMGICDWRVLLWTWRLSRNFPSALSIGSCCRHGECQWLFLCIDYVAGEVIGPTLQGGVRPELFVA